MKHYRKGFLAIVLAALGVCAYEYLPAHTAPAIAVKLDAKGNGGGVQIPAVNGYVGGMSGSGSGTSSDSSWDAEKCSYTVISTANKHFVILAHYDLDWNGATSSVDRTLPVWSKRPDKAQWAKVDNHFAAYAYFTGTRTDY